MTNSIRRVVKAVLRRPLAWPLRWLRRQIDVRASWQVSQLEAQLQELRRHDDVRKAIEVRAQIAADDAKSYADHGLGVLGASLAAANRVVVDAAKRLGAAEGALASAREESARQATELRGLGGTVERELRTIVDDYNTQLRSVERRVEFVRSEIMYELQASTFRGSARTPARTVARIVEPEKVEAMRPTGLRLNVGCGHIPLDGYLNVDGRALPGIDVVADATDLPFQENELAEIHSAHLVEHFTSHILERVLLPHWSALLQPGGVLTTVAPDGAAMLHAVTSGEMAFDDFREVIFGGQDYGGDFHYNMLTPTTFSETLKRAGFKHITEDYTGKRNGKCFEFRISARKG